MYSIHAFLLQKELFRSPEPVKTSVVSSFTDTPALQQIARQADSDYILFYTGTSPIELHPYAIGRMYQIAESNDGALFYSDYQEIRQGKKIHHPNFITVPLAALLPRTIFTFKCARGILCLWKKMPPMKSSAVIW